MSTPSGEERLTSLTELPWLRNMDAIPRTTSSSAPIGTTLTTVLRLLLLIGGSLVARW
jgi:hypothetical protein